jgi:hypothetical protein
MTLPPPIFNDFFRNPFGGEMKSIGGMGGEGGVLENIQQQVADNGEALQALQGGIGGLPNTPFQPAINQPISYEKIAYENPGQLPNLLDFNPPTSVADAASDIDSQLRAEYDELVASAKKRRDEGFLGRMVLPGENLSFEQFKKMQLKPGSPFDMLGGPMQSDIFNIAQPEQNPGIGLIQEPGISYITGNLYDDTSTGPPQILSDTPRSYGVQLQNFGNRGYTGGGTPPVFSDGVNVNQNPTPSMDQLFGRAFAGKPI